MSDKSTESSGTRGILLLLLCIGWLCYQAMNSQKPEPTPPPVPAISSEIETANTEASQALTRHLRDVIEQLESGKLTDERQTRDLLAAGAKAAQEAAWLPVKQRDVTAFADGWTPAKQIARLKAMIGE